MPAQGPPNNRFISDYTHLEFIIEQKDTYKMENQGINKVRTYFESGDGF